MDAALPLSRRRWLAAAGALLTACGGGGDDSVPHAAWRVVSRFTTSGQASIGTSDGGVLVAGGSRGEPVLSRSVEHFDAGARRFVAVGAMGAGRSGHRLLRLADGRLLVVGGVTSENVWPFAEWIDERSGATGPAGDLVQPRHWHAAVALADGRALVVGGLGRDTAELWDPATRRWRLVASRLAHERQYPSATRLPDGRVLVVGGVAAGGGGVFAELFDPRTDTFRHLDDPAAVARQLHAAHLSATGVVQVLGGEDGSGRPLAEVLGFDPVRERFDRLSPLAVARSAASLLPLADGRLWLAGGSTPDDAASAGTECWSPGGAQGAPPLPGPRLWHGAHRLADGRLLVFGGDDAQGNFTPDVLMNG